VTPWIRAYVALGALVIGALGWAHWRGWSPEPVSEVKAPASMRDNPGSYRSSYGRGPFVRGK
jgi:hypothetical protein